MTELHPLINFGKFPIFGIMVAIGFISSAALYIYNSNKINDERYIKEDLIILLGISFLIGIATSNISNWFIYPEYQALALLEKIKFAGYTFYFGLIGFLVSIFILLKLFKYRYSEYLNEIVPSITLFHAIGRTGCLLGGCCYGKICEITFFSLEIERFPVREMEILILISLTILFQIKIKKNRIYLYLTVYPSARFFIEYMRGDNRGYLFIKFLSPSQIISLIIIGIIVTILFFKMLRINSKKIIK